MKKILAILLAGILMGTVLAGCGESGTGSDTGSTGSTGETKKEYVMGLDINFPPMGFADEQGNPIGFDIDLAKAVADKMGVTFKLQPIDWNSKEVELKGGKVDILWNGLTITEEREKEMLFTKPYLQNKQVVVVLQDSSIKTLADMKGKKVVLQKGSTAVDALKEEKNKTFADSLKETTQLADNMACFQEVELKRADAVVIDEVVAKYYLSKHEGKFRILDETLADEFYGIAVQLGNTELRDNIQNALDALYAEGKITEICKTWVGEDIYYPGE